MAASKESQPTLAQQRNCLARKAKGGDREAFEQLVREFTPALISFYRRKGVPNTDIEDLAQETWLQVVRSLGRFDPARDLTAWVFAVAYHLWIDRLRRPVPKERWTLFFPDIPDYRQMPVADTVLTAERIARVAECVRECVDELAPDEQEIVRLRFWEDCSLQAIGKRMGREYGSIKGKAHRAALKLRTCLQGKGTEDS
jgi:RNA polymerase sigma-70 factor (ECF subfamily)